MSNIGFVGLGKLGLECAEVFSSHYKTYGYDIHPIQSSSIKIIHNLKDLVEISDWIFIAVPTPHEDGYDGSLPTSHLPPKDFNYSSVIRILKAITEYATSSKNVVLISTVLPGTIRKTLIQYLDKKHKFLYNPYLIAMGSVKWDMINPEMIIIGHEDSVESTNQLIEIYKPMMQNNPRYVVSTWEEAESIKIFYNTFISAKITLVNMIQDFAERIENINVDVVTDALAQSNIRITSSKYMTAGLGDSGACHPRDNIALRWLAQEYNLGYDIFDTIMYAREIQAKNLAEFLINLHKKHNLPIVIHGKSYKPDVSYCIGSYSTLISHYLKINGISLCFVDPLADDRTDVVENVTYPSIILLAHNRQITYGYTGQHLSDREYFKFLPGSIVVDPWRKYKGSTDIQVVYYGNNVIDKIRK